MRKIYCSLLAMLMLIGCFFLCGCGPVSCVGVGTGVDYSFSEGQDFSSLSDYRYSETKTSFWDHYYVEYDITAFELSYEKSWFNPNNKYPQLSTTHTTLTDVAAVGTKGKMAHSKGIYYISESSWGITVELLVDTVYNAFACKISGNVISELLFDEVQFTDQWLCFDNSSYIISDDILSGYLIILNHFYDEEILSLFNSHMDSFECVRGVYTAKDFSLIKSELHSWFLLNGLEDCNSTSKHQISGFNWEITEGKVSIDLSVSSTPQVSFALTAWYPSIDKSVRCGGKLKYSNVNNIVLHIPDEVVSEWQKYEGYDRDI